MKPFYLAAVAALLPCLPVSGAHAAALPLGEAVREAEAQSPVMQKAALPARGDEVEEGREALSGFLPTVSANASYLLAKQWAVLDFTLGRRHPRHSPRSCPRPPTR